MTTTVLLWRLLAVSSSRALLRLESVEWDYFWSRYLATEILSQLLDEKATFTCWWSSEFLLLKWDKSVERRYRLSIEGCRTEPLASAWLNTCNCTFRSSDISAVNSNFCLIVKVNHFRKFSGFLPKGLDCEVHCRQKHNFIFPIFRTIWHKWCISVNMESN